MYNRIVSILLVILMLLSVGALVNIGYSAPKTEDTSQLDNLSTLAVDARTSHMLMNTVIVIKGDTPISTVEAIYNRFRDVKIVIEGREFSGLYSRLIRNRAGDYVFKVVGYPGQILSMLGKYKSYLHFIQYKPVVNYMNALEAKGPNPRVEGGVAKKIKPGPNTFIVDQLIGAMDVWYNYGYTGLGINISIVDTGVDYAHPDLQSKLVYFNGFYNHTKIREPLILDADESQVIMLSSFVVSAGTIDVSSAKFGVITPSYVSLSAPYGTYDVNNVTTKSGILKFGVTFMSLPAYGWTVVGVLMSDPVTAGNYTELIIDANNNGVFNETTYDAFASYDGNRILAVYSGGWPYISFGVAGGFFFDVGWYFDRSSKFYPGWNLSGNYISIFYDFYGHGTACASAAAGSGAGWIPGVAPDANIIGVKALWFGAIEPGWLWAAGFDVDPVNGHEFKYTGWPRANILSNSWGISYFDYDIAGLGYDYISMLANALMYPGYYNSSYPGVLIVMAAGNGGGGYGTVTSAGAASIPLTVGASTSTHPYAMYYGFGDYTQDEVVGWSARGPVPTGEVKPDVVNVGAYGITAAPVGIDYWIFGGTSYATPLTAGAAALLYQAIMNTIPWWNYNPIEVKSILMMSADPLKYSAFDQGAGRVNINRAVNMSMGLYAGTSPSDELGIWNIEHYLTVMNDKLSSIWYWMMRDYIPYQLMYYYNNYIYPKTYSVPLPYFFFTPHYSIYVDDIPQGGSKNFTFTVANLGTNTASIAITPVKLVRFKSVSSNLKISVSSHDVLGRYEYIILSKKDIPKSAELMMVSSYIPYKVFDGDDDYLSDWETYVIAYVWINDTNMDGIPDVDERAIVNFDESNSTMNRLMIKNPRQLLSMFGPQAKLLIRVWLWRSSDLTPAKTEIRSQKVGVRIEYYRYMPDPSVKIEGRQTYYTVLASGSLLDLNGTISVGDVAPTVYQGFLKVESQMGSTYREYYVPYSYTVYTTLDRGRRVINNYPGGNKVLYSWRSLRGDTDWYWRFESGDWRLFYVKVTGHNAWLLEVDAKWRDKYTSLLTFTLAPDGQFAGYSSISRYVYMGSGVFMWTDTGYRGRAVSRNVKTFPSITYRLYRYPYESKPALGVYTIVVRNILYGGKYYPEEFTVSVKVIKNKNMLPSSVQPTSGSLNIVFKPPYPATEVYVSITHYLLPWNSSQYSCNYNTLYITPSSYTTTLSSYSFTLVWGNLMTPPGGAKRIDIAVAYTVNMPSIPVYYRYGGSYYILTSYYPFEDYITTVSSSFY